MYQAPLDDMKFVLRHLVGIDRVAAMPGYDMVSDDLVDAVLDEAGKLLVSRDHGQSFAPVALKQTASFTDVVQARDGSLVLSSARGALHVPAAAVAADAAVAGTASGVAKP